MTTCGSPSSGWAPAATWPTWCTGRVAAPASWRASTRGRARSATLTMRFGPDVRAYADHRDARSRGRRRRARAVARRHPRADRDRPAPRRRRDVRREAARDHHRGRRPGARRGPRRPAPGSTSGTTCGTRRSSLAMRELIASGAIGRVTSIWCRHFVGHGGDYYFKDWHADRRRSTGLLLQKGAHDIDIMHWLAGGRTDGGQRVRLARRLRRHRRPRGPVGPADAGVVRRGDLAAASATVACIRSSTSRT